MTLDEHGRLVAPSMDGGQQLRNVPFYNRTLSRTREVLTVNSGIDAQNKWEALKIRKAIGINDEPRYHIGWRHGVYDKPDRFEVVHQKSQGTERWEKTVDIDRNLVARYLKSDNDTCHTY